MPRNNGSVIPTLKTAVYLILLALLTPCVTIAQNQNNGTTNTPAPQGAANGSEVEFYVDELYKKIEESGHFVNQIKPNDMTLPVGLVREINGNVYVIAIDSVKLTTKGATMSVYFRFTFPGTNSELIFGGKNIGITPGGIETTLGTKLVLLNSKTIPISEQIDLKFPGDGTNFIEWDCNGFKSATLNGMFEFNKTWIAPDDPKQDTLKCALKLVVNDFNNMMAGVDVPAFHIKGLEDYSFKVKTAYLDWSDMTNPPGLPKQPKNVMDSAHPELWHGFYLKELEVGLPKQMGDSNRRPVINATDFIIDHKGVSGTISARNVVQLGNAAIGGWPISLDTVAIAFSQNNLNGGHLAGRMRIGFLGDDPLTYGANITYKEKKLNYDFLLETDKKRTRQFFAGEIVLNEDCTISVQKNDSAFVAQATLNGDIKMNKKAVYVKNVKFEKLILNSKKPYIGGGTFTVDTDGESKVGGFPVQIDDIKMVLLKGQDSKLNAAKDKEMDSLAFAATVRLNFMKASDKGFSGSTGFTLSGSRQNDSSSWKFGNVKIRSIALDVKVTAFKLNGSVAFFDSTDIGANKKDGNGFRGSLDVTIPKVLPAGGAKASAIFGSTADFRYWHADVWVGVQMPIAPTLKIIGLMGGLSYHMQRPPDFDPYDVREAVDKKGGVDSLFQIFKYIPCDSCGLGLMAGVSLALNAEAIVNANTSLEVQFGTDGSFRYAQFDGAGYMLHAPVKARSSADVAAVDNAPAWTEFKMRFDNVNNSFDANIKTYINLPGVMRGIYARGFVGEAAMHIGDDDWYLYVGRPSSMLGLNMAGLVETKSYFMMGSKVEGMPSLPKEVTNIAPQLSTNFMAVENGMKGGGGLGFGVHFRSSFAFDFGVYGEFAVGAGADVLLRDYGDDARCKGSNSPIGINGWYAAGQAYAYLSGDVGIRIKVFKKKRSFSIAKLAAAVVVQAKAPNPAWFRGVVAVNYSVLGGLVKGKANITVELGTQCEILGARELEVEMINSIAPNDGASEVSVFTAPQVAFNMPVAKPFEMLNNFDEVETYRLKLDYVKLLRNGAEILGETAIAADGLSATMTQNDILPGKTKLNISAKVHIEKLSGAAWTPLQSGDSADAEIKNTSFTTAAPPDYIPWENVAFAYPVRDQYNFLPGEYNKGYIRLKMGQPDLFLPVDAKGGKWAVNAVFHANAGDSVSVNVGYDPAQKQVNFDIPGDLAKESVYAFSVKRSSLDGVAAGNNVVNNATTTTDANGSTTTISNNTLQGDAASGLSKEMIAINFHTSRYSTFAQKMNATSGARNLFDVATGYVSVIGQRLITDETLDQFEIAGDPAFSTKPLVYLTAGMDNSWLKDDIMPLLYDGYPFAPGLEIQRDAATVAGIPPLDAIRIYNDDNSLYKLEESNVTTNSRSGSFRFMYYLSYVAHNDYMDLLAKAGRYSLNSKEVPSKVANLLTRTYPDLKGNLYYPVNLQYRLPGTNQITSTVTKSIYYKL